MELDHERSRGDRLRGIHLNFVVDLSAERRNASEQESGSEKNGPRTSRHALYP